jgi:hypothetical protein
MKPHYILLSLLLLGMTGCVTIVKWKYGITNPREQTPVKLASFLAKHHYPDSCQYVLADSSVYFRGFRNPVFRKNLFSHMIFDSAGRLVQRDTAACQWSGYEVIKALHPDSAYPVVPGLLLGDLLPDIRPLGGTRVPAAPANPAGFTIVITWAKFLGTFNDRLFELAEAAGMNQTARVRLIFLNVDMQECWKLTKDQKMEIR